MRVRFNTAIAGLDFSYPAYRVVEVNDKEAQKYIKIGTAVELNNNAPIGEKVGEVVPEEFLPQKKKTTKKAPAKKTKQTEEKAE